MASAFFVVVYDQFVFEDWVKISCAAFACYSEKLYMCACVFAFGFFCGFFVAFFVSFFVAFVVSVFVGCASGFVCFVFQVGVWPPFSLWYIVCVGVN